MRLAMIRSRMLSAMGLALAGCPSNAQGPEPIVPVPVAPATPTMTVDAGAAPTPSASAAPKPAAASWTVSFPLSNPTPVQWCAKEGTARCFDASEVPALPGTATSKSVPRCAVEIPVACACRHRHCQPDDGQSCREPLLEKLTAVQRRQGRADACCYEIELYCGHPGEGRPLWSTEGRPVVSSSIPRKDFRRNDLAPAPREAEAWDHIAAFEHASVASFAMLSLDLLALGAPAELLVRTHRAALDEIRHAETAYALASPGSAPRGPGPLAIPARKAPSLERLAVEALRDGCFGETRAAMSLYRRAQAADDPAHATALLEMANDELDHAELAFRIVAWAVHEGGSPVRDALLAASARIDPHPVLFEVVMPCLTALAA